MRKANLKVLKDELLSNNKIKLLVLPNAKCVCIMYICHIFQYC